MSAEITRDLGAAMTTPVFTVLSAAMNKSGGVELEQE
jgi:hypothetical protein